MPGARCQHCCGPRIIEVNEVWFASVVIRAEVFSTIGYLDPCYILGGFEDVDFCYRTRRAGFKVICNPHIKIIHMHQATFKRMPSTIRLWTGSANDVRFCILNRSLRELLGIILWSLLRSRTEFSWLTRGFVTLVKWYGILGVVCLIVKGIKRRLFNDVYISFNLSSLHVEQLKMLCKGKL